MHVCMMHASGLDAKGIVDESHPLVFGAAAGAKQVVVRTVREPQSW